MFFLQHETQNRAKLGFSAVSMACKIYLIIYGYGTKDTILVNGIFILEECLYLVESIWTRCLAFHPLREYIVRNQSY